MQVTHRNKIVTNWQPYPFMPVGNPIEFLFESSKTVFWIKDVCLPAYPINSNFSIWTLYFDSTPVAGNKIIINGFEYEFVNCDDDASDYSLLISLMKFNQTGNFCDLANSIINTVNNDPQVRSDFFAIPINDLFLDCGDLYGNQNSLNSNCSQTSCYITFISKKIGVELLTAIDGVFGHWEQKCQANDNEKINYRMILYPSIEKVYHNDNEFILTNRLIAQPIYNKGNKKDTILNFYKKFKFDVANMLKPYLREDVPSLATENIQIAVNCIKNYYIEFADLYNDKTTLKNKQSKLYKSAIFRVLNASLSEFNSNLHTNFLSLGNTCVESYSQPYLLKEYFAPDSIDKQKFITNWESKSISSGDYEFLHYWVQRNYNLSQIKAIFDFTYLDGTKETKTSDFDFSKTDACEKRLSDDEIIIIIPIHNLLKKYDLSKISSFCFSLSHPNCNLGRGRSRSIIQFNSAGTVNKIEISSCFSIDFEALGCGSPPSASNANELAYSIYYYLRDCNSSNWQTLKNKLNIEITASDGAIEIISDSISFCEIPDGYSFATQTIIDDNYEYNNPAHTGYQGLDTNPPQNLQHGPCWRYDQPHRALHLSNNFQDYVKNYAEFYMYSTSVWGTKDNPGSCGYVDYKIFNGYGEIYWYAKKECLPCGYKFTYCSRAMGQGLIDGDDNHQIIKGGITPFVCCENSDCCFKNVTVDTDASYSATATFCCNGDEPYVKISENKHYLINNQCRDNRFGFLYINKLGVCETFYQNGILTTGFEAERKNYDRNIFNNDNLFHAPNDRQDFSISNDGNLTYELNSILYNDSEKNEFINFFASPKIWQIETECVRNGCFDGDCDDYSDTQVVNQDCPSAIKDYIFIDIPIGTNISNPIYTKFGIQITCDNNDIFVFENYLIQNIGAPASVIIKEIINAFNYNIVNFFSNANQGDAFLAKNPSDPFSVRLYVKKSFFEFCDCSLINAYAYVCDDALHNCLSFLNENVANCCETTCLVPVNFASVKIQINEPLAGYIYANPFNNACFGLFTENQSCPSAIDNLPDMVCLANANNFNEFLSDIYAYLLNKYGDGLGIVRRENNIFEIWIDRSIFDNCGHNYKICKLENQSPCACEFELQYASQSSGCVGNNETLEVQFNCGSGFISMFIVNYQIGSNLNNTMQNIANAINAVNGFKSYSILNTVYIYCECTVLDTDCGGNCPTLLPNVINSGAGCFTGESHSSCEFVGGSGQDLQVSIIQQTTCCPPVPIPKPDAIDRKIICSDVLTPISLLDKDININNSYYKEQNINLKYKKSNRLNALRNV